MFLKALSTMSTFTQSNKSFRHTLPCIQLYLVSCKCNRTIFIQVDRLCTSASSRQSTTRLQWDSLSRVKAKILAIVNDDSVHMGRRLVALRFMHKVIIVQTKGVTDPRVSIAICLLLSIVDSY